MSELPRDYVPPKALWADKIYPLPEVRLPRRMNLADICLDRNIREGRGDKVALRYQDRAHTFAELQRQVNRAANALRGLGIERNDRVMLRSPNRPEFLVGCFACWRIGAIPVLVNHMLRSEEIVFRANDSEAKAVLVSADTLAEVEKSLGHFETVKHVVVFGDRVAAFPSWEDLLAGQDERVESVEIERDDFIRIIYSSGTTGKPKGILTPAGDALAIREVGARHLLGLREDDVLGGHPAFTFAFGFAFLMFFGYAGCTLSIVERFDPELMFETIDAHRISVLCCVPTAFRMMLGVPDAARRWDMGSLRLCQSAGEWLPGATVKDWRERFGVTILDAVGSGDLHYWLATRPDTPDDKLDSSGVPLVGVECKVVDEDFEEVPRGTVGELLVRAPWGQHYWRRPDKQRAAVARGWNRPGLVYLEDEDGYFWYKGRDDEMIVSAGYKIPGGEVEAALLSHAAVLEAAVVGAPDPVRGSVVKAFVVLRPGHTPTPALAEELKAFVKDRIEAYKYPREIEFVDGAALSRTTTGKIQRFVLREQETARRPRTGETRETSR